MTPYRVEILAHVEDAIRRLPPDIKRGVREAIRAIGLKPGRGEALRRELRNYMKCRVRRYRIIYHIDRSARRITLMAVGHRRTIYDELTTSLRRTGN